MMMSVPRCTIWKQLKQQQQGEAAGESYLRHVHLDLNKVTEPTIEHDDVGAALQQV
jgi:hypothetical protein